MDTKMLLGKIDNRSAAIGIVGLGYVGLPLMLRFTEAGYRVIGFDIDQAKVDVLNKGVSYIKHISATSINSVITSELFEGTTDFSRAEEVETLIVCVPTPLNKHREPDLTFVINSVDSIVPYLHKGQIVSLESTKCPVTTEEELLPKRGLKVGQDGCYRTGHQPRR